MKPELIHLAVLETLGTARDPDSAAWYSRTAVASLKQRLGELKTLHGTAKKSGSAEPTELEQFVKKKEAIVAKRVEVRLLSLV